MATLSKAFSFFRWKNRPDTSTPLGQTLLNRINEALNEIDNRVIILNSQKASTDEIQGVFTDVRLIKNTGQFVFTLFDGTEKIIDTALEKISINVSFDKETQMMVLEKEDGSKEYVDLSVFTTQYEFVSSPTIQQTVTDGKVRADIKPNSISDQMLQTNYLADITTQANTAVSASQSALENQSLAEQHAEEADAQADRAKAEADRAEEAADRAEAVTGITVDTTLDTNSSNPIANKAVAEAFENVDAKSLEGHRAEYFAPLSELAKYFPLTGGYASGAIGVNKADNTEATVRAGNPLGIIELIVSASGRRGLYDRTNGAWLCDIMPDGTKTFNGTASGNLPLDVGGEVKSTAVSPIRVNNTGGNAKTLFGFLNQGILQGYFGFNGKDKPIFQPSTGGEYNIIHAGNITDYVAADSETGTFTLKLNGVTLGTGTYYKVGKMVHCQATGNFPQEFTAGYVSLTGLPFANASLNGSIVDFHTHQYFGKASDNLVFNVGASEITLNLTASIGQNQPFIFSIIYFTE